MPETRIARDRDRGGSGGAGRRTRCVRRLVVLRVVGVEGGLLPQLRGARVATPRPGHAADELSKVGTPSDIGSSARHGFDLLVSHLRDLPDKRSPGGITKMVQDMNDRDAADVRDFITYYASECQGVSGDVVLVSRGPSPGGRRR